MPRKSDVLRETDANAIRLGRALIREAQYAALAVIEPETGFPFVSRALLATDIDGVPAIAISKLATHFGAIMADDRVSLLTGVPGKGDPLAHPRMTTLCRAVRVEKGSEDHARLRARFLRRHPKAALYIDFPDFFLFRLRPISASLNGGFGRAYALDASDLVSEDALSTYVGFDAEAAISSANSLLADANTTKHNCIDADPEGVDLKNGSEYVRLDLNSTAIDAHNFVALLASSLEKIP
ncbi:HugZ family protein [Martelella endophytica]|uniref:HugZ family pyridoxamine 5'-phosphate oxidase n=1 Tax=Martelella endophytica TaxID=1486262 RepID=UPI000A8CBCD5|nr:HugZ family protein [Martelella endophytica]